MKLLTVLSLALVAALLFINSCVPQRPDANQVRTIMEETDASMIKAMLAKDDSAVASFYAEDAVLLPSNGPMLKGRDQIRAFYKEVIPGLRDFRITHVKAEVADSLAYEIGQYVRSVELPTGVAVQDTGKFVGVYKLQPDGKWLMVADMANSDIPLPPPTPEKRKK